jgi:Transglutaminase-like superfamily
VVLVPDRFIIRAMRREVGAVASRHLARRRRVCRDFAHLMVALLRAVNVPARVVSVYAPGLYPMDLHAVAETFVEGEWRVVDGTLLAPRQTVVRIATGRDAADNRLSGQPQGRDHTETPSTTWRRSAKRRCGAHSIGATPVVPVQRLPVVGVGVAEQRTEPRQVILRGPDKIPRTFAPGR